MLPKLEKIPLNTSSSIAVKKEVTPYMDYPWHYHPEFEIIFVEKSYGIRLMGNHIGNFGDGDLMFISPNLPHVWRNDKDFYQGNTNCKVVVYVIHFREDALGENFFVLPEFAHIRKLFVHGQQGILIRGKEHRELSGLIKKVYNASGIDRLVLFLKTLDTFANAQEYELLSTPGYINSVNLLDTQRINKVVNFLMEHYTQEIDLEKIARLVNLNKSSFCRYFKARTHKTCSQFLNEIRIAHACKLLVSTNMTASQVCYEIGYNNVSHFNRQFKLITGTTTKGYVKKYLKSADG
jgi:AraC-like DNA-binding protein